MIASPNDRQMISSHPRGLQSYLRDTTLGYVLTNWCEYECSRLPQCAGCRSARPGVEQLIEFDVTVRPLYRNDWVSELNEIPLLYVEQPLADFFGVFLGR